MSAKFDNRLCAMLRERSVEIASVVFDVVGLKYAWVFVILYEVRLIFPRHHPHALYFLLLWNMTNFIALTEAGTVLEIVAWTAETYLSLGS